MVSPFLRRDSLLVAGELGMLLVMSQPFSLVVNLTPRWSISSFHGVGFFQAVKSWPV